MWVSGELAARRGLRRGNPVKLISCNPSVHSWGLTDRRVGMDELGMQTEMGRMVAPQRVM